MVLEYYYPHLDCFIKRRELEKEEEVEEETNLHAGLLSTGTVCHLQPRRYQSSVHLKSTFALLYYFRPNLVFLDNLSLSLVGESY